MIFPIFFFLLGFISFVNTQSFPNWEELDGEGKVFLGWEFDSKTELITFQMQVETTGWVGLGISPGGSMLGADIFIGGVHSDSSTYSDVSK